MRKFARAGVIIKKDNAYLLMKRIKPDRTYYAILGGRPENNETPQEAAIREVQEEATLIVTLKPEPIIIDDGVYNHPEYYFWADTIEGTPQLGGEEKEISNPDNIFQLEWVSANTLASIVLLPESMHQYLLTLD